MNLNGAAKTGGDPETGDELKNWVIAYVGETTGWIGRTYSERADGTLILYPAYAYDAGTQTQQKGDQVSHGRMRRVLPAEMLASNVTIECRPHSVLRLGDLDAHDREYVLRDVLAPAFHFHKMLRAQRAGIVAATPADLAKLPKVRG